MPEGNESKQDKYGPRLKESVEQLRGNVKWTLLAFGAIGTTLLAGSQLSNLGKFHYGDSRLWLALACALIALFAAAYAVNVALKVANTGHVDINRLTAADQDYISNSTGLLGGYASTDQLRQQYLNRIEERFQHLEA